MLRSSLFKITIVVIIAAVFLVVGVVYILSSYDFRLQEARKRIEDAIRPEFLPSGYSLTKGCGPYDFLGFGARYADHLYMNWRINNVYLIAVFAYSKNFPYQLMGYSLNAWVKDPDEIGYALASEVFGSLPSSGWEQPDPSSIWLRSYNLSSVLWYSGSDQVYVKVIREKYVPPLIFVMPGEESVQDIAQITYLCVTPFNTNPAFSNMKYTQISDLYFIASYEKIEIMSAFVLQSGNNFMVNISYVNTGATSTSIVTIFLNGLPYSGYEKITLDGDFAHLPSACETGESKEGTIIFPIRTEDIRGYILTHGVTLTIELRTAGFRDYYTSMTLP